MKDLTRGNIYKNFILFAIPMVLSALLSQGYNMIDNIIAGKFLGSNGLAAIGSTAAFISFASSLFWGFAAGASIYTASLFGAKNYKQIKFSVYHNIGLTLVTSAVFAIIIIIFAKPLLSLLRIDANIFDDARTYLIIYMSGFSFVLLTNNFLQIMNAFGIGTFPLAMSVASAVLNITGNIVSVTVLDLGVAGIALSTVVSAFVVDVLYLIRLKQCFREMNVTDIKVNFCRRVIKNLVSFSVPTALQQAVMYTSTMLISPLVNGIGSSASAAYTVVMRIYDINAGIYQNSAKTVSNYTAHCRGAGRPLHYYKKGVRVGLLQGLLFLSVPLLICILFAKPVCGLFFPSGYEGESLSLAVLFSKFYLPFIIFNMINNLFHAYYRGTGSMHLLVILTSLGSVARLVFTYLLTGFGMNGIYSGWIFAWIFEAIIALITYFTGMWKKNIIPID